MSIYLKEVFDDKDSTTPTSIILNIDNFNILFFIEYDILVFIREFLLLITNKRTEDVILKINNGGYYIKKNNDIIILTIFYNTDLPFEMSIKINSSKELIEVITILEEKLLKCLMEK